MIETKIASLRVRITGGTDGRGGGDGPVVVLMHGFGAGGDDLVPLAKMMRVPAGVRFVFPEAPHALPASMGGYGRMWWAIDSAALVRAMTEGGLRDMRTDDPPGLVEARALVVAMLAELRTMWTIPAGGLFLGGFSQGSMLACDVALRTSVQMDSLVVLSGTMLVHDAWAEGMLRRRGMPVFQSHGTDDSLLSFAIAEQLGREFEASGMPTRWVPFRGGHDIPPAVLGELSAFITKHA